MKEINYGEIGTILLFGGGEILGHVALKLKEKGLPVFVATSTRYITERINSLNFDEFLIENNIKFEMTSDINSNSKIIEMIKEDSLGISIGAPWIFKKEFIDIFRGRLLNCHPRNLPRNRGAGGYSWMILNGEKESAALLHLIEPGIDTGEIVKREDFLFPESCKIPLDYEKYSTEKIKCFLELFIDDLIQRKTFKLVSQDESKSTYFPRLHTLTQGLINWDWTAEEIICFINAFDDSYCGASTYYRSKKVFIKKVSESKEKENFHPFLAGLVYRIHKNKVFIATKDGGIVVSEIKNEEGSSILEKLRVGKRFFTPYENLEGAKRIHPVYTPDGLK
jgi:methionyl-tRNA formyltransferase